MQGARTTRTSLPSFAGQLAQQLLRARHRAGERVAHAHRDRRRRRLAFLHHVEMRVEGRDLVDLGERHLHLGGERREMRGGEMAVAVLDQMQMLDQQIAPARPVAQQRAHFFERLRVDLAALRRAAADGGLRPAPLPPDRADCWHVHRMSFSYALEEAVPVDQKQSLQLPWID